jgi:prefoldin subunit 5
MIRKWKKTKQNKKIRIYYIFEIKSGRSNWIESRHHDILITIVFHFSYFIYVLHVLILFIAKFCYFDICLKRKTTKYESAESSAPNETESSCLNCAQLEKEIVSLKEEISSLKGELSSVKAAVVNCAQLEKEIASLKEEMSSLKGEMSSVKGEIPSVKGEMSSLKTSVAQREAEIKELKEKEELAEKVFVPLLILLSFDVVADPSFPPPSLNFTTIYPDEFPLFLGNPEFWRKSDGKIEKILNEGKYDSFSLNLTFTKVCFVSSLFVMLPFFGGNLGIVLSFFLSRFIFSCSEFKKECSKVMCLSCFLLSVLFLSLKPCVGSSNQESFFPKTNLLVMPLVSLFHSLFFVILHSLCLSFRHSGIQSLVYPLLPLYFSTLSLLFRDGNISVNNKQKPGNAPWKDKGTDVMMEVNMSSTPRTLRFFVNGEQQKMSFINIPTSIQFAVCLSPLIL